MQATAPPGEPAPRLDPRIRRTRALLHEAVRSLAVERPVGEVSVADIAERATVSRATFYLHYADRDELLIDVIDTMIIAEATAAGRPGAVPPDLTEATPVPEFLIEFMRDIEANAALFRQVLGADGSARVLAHLRTQLQTALQSLIAAIADPASRLVPDDVLAAWTGGALLGVIVHWLEQPRPRPARTVATEIWRLAIQPAARRR